eukprot:3544040-Amphidinium_carterae.1
MSLQKSVARQQWFLKEQIPECITYTSGCTSKPAGPWVEVHAGTESRRGEATWPIASRRGESAHPDGLVQSADNA